MYAVARLNTYDAAALTAAGDRLADFDAVHSAHPGYLGSIVVDLGQGKRLIVNLWESEDHSDAARAALGPQIGRALKPLMIQPAEFLGAGPVLTADLQRLETRLTESGTGTSGSPAPRSSYGTATDLGGDTPVPSDT
jgi:hypothetical protein